MTVMGREKKADAHKAKQINVRLHASLRKQLNKLVSTNASDLTEEVRIAIRERLERAALWPPKPNEG
jgi:hypothetical protein